jgi:hypothetical protein
MQDQGKGSGASGSAAAGAPYEPFSYNAFDLADPFKPRKIEPVKGAASSRRI